MQNLNHFVVMLVELEYDDRPCLNPMKPFLHDPMILGSHNVFLGPAKVNGGIGHGSSLAHGLSGCGGYGIRTWRVTCKHIALSLLLKIRSYIALQTHATQTTLSKHDGLATKSGGMQRWGLQARDVSSLEA